MYLGKYMLIIHFKLAPLIHLKSSSKIYRCWIVWGQDIRIVILPAFLAIAYIGQFNPHFYSYNLKPEPISSYLVSVS